MGDIADEHYNQMIDDGHWIGSIRQREVPQTVCKRCGSHEVYWHTSLTGYSLHSNQTGKPHVCDEANMRKTLVNDFEDLDE